MGYDEAEAERQRQIDAEYSRLCNEYEYEAMRNAELASDADACLHDVSRSITLVNGLHRAVMPHMTTTSEQTIREETIAKNASMVIDDLVDSYILLKNESTATKNLTASRDKYYTLYGPYNELRQVSLGYVVGLDKNFWTSDVPRKTVEKMYISNTDYWLAYATMAVMLWASDEREACQRAVSKAMQINERRSALFFLLAALRFNRTEAAKKWYKVYFSLVELGGIGEEILYILQALLMGALGADLEFRETVDRRIGELITDAKTDLYMRRDAQAAVDRYFECFISVSEKEFLALKHICAEYDALMQLLSDAEKNDKLKDYFLSVINRNSEMSDRLSERIEDSLYSLISAPDESEQELLDKISYEEMVVKANGKIDVAQRSFKQIEEEKMREHNIALIMVNAALNGGSKAHTCVKKYALDYVSDYCVEAAEKYAGYRKREKKELDFNVDGCELRGDENSFEANKPLLLEYYRRLIKEATKADKAVRTLKKAMIGAGGLVLLMTILCTLGFVLHWKVASAVVSILLAIVFIAAIALCAYLLHDRKAKIRHSFDFRIENGVNMLKTGLEDLARWREAYTDADSGHDRLLKVLKEEVNNG